MNGSGRPDELCKKGVPIILQNSQESTCARVSFLIKLQAEVCNCEFCEISKNIFSYRTPPVAASVWNWFCLVLLALLIKFFIIELLTDPSEAVFCIWTVLRFSTALICFSAASASSRYWRFYQKFDNFLSSIFILYC